jgi:hypothetical protein
LNFCAKLSRVDDSWLGKKQNCTKSRPYTVKAISQFP